MAVFFGKFSSDFPDQINDGFYKTSRHHMFGDLQPQDLVYAIGGDCKSSNQSGLFELKNKRVFSHYFV
jgi:hypothetical protein